MIGIVGPEDSVALVLRVAAEMGISQQVVARAYQLPEQAPRLALELDSVCQVIVFTGRVPYSVARQAGSLRAHLEFVAHSGIDLYRSLVLLLRTYDGRLPVLSIDTIEPEIIAEVWRDLELEPPTAILPLSESARDARVRDSASITAFHLAAWRAGSVEACVTCFRSVYDALLAQGVTAFRVEHTRASVRDALSRASQLAERTAAEAQQIAVGLLEYAPEILPTDDGTSHKPDIRASLAGVLHARVQPVDERMDVLFTTWGTLRGILEHQPPHARQLLAAADQVVVGFGLGATVPRAEENARRALILARVERAPHVAFADGTARRLDEFGDTHTLAFRTRDPELLDYARALGMSAASVQRVFAALQQVDTTAISAGDLADALGLGPRSARRILLRLQRHGIVEPSGSEAGPGAGRPRTLYRVQPGRLLGHSGRAPQSSVG